MLLLLNQTLSTSQPTELSNTVIHRWSWEYSSAVVQFLPCSIYPSMLGALALLLLLRVANSELPAHVRYVVIGAGPGGMQIGHYLDSAGRDYVILEQRDCPGSFFKALPRFRQLISINKLHSGRDELDHAMRHDWNSLLADPSHSVTTASANRLPATMSSTHPEHRLSSARRSWLLFRNYSNSYYPHADDMVDYLSHWARGWQMDDTAPEATVDAGHPSRPLRIYYNTTVTRVARLQLLRKAGAPLPPRFSLSLADGGTLTCTFLVLATGLQEPVEHAGVNVAEAMQQGWLRSYHNASTDLNSYVGARVLLLGRGNAAFEFANSLLEVAASVHLLGRNSRRLRLAYETHYPVRNWS
jgi:hypothetical protein